MTTPKFTLPDTMWAGSEQSYLVAGEAHQALMSRSFVDSQPKPELPYMLSIQDGIGVIKISGPLVNGDSESYRYYGVSTYSDIRRALVTAATDPEIKGIVLDIDSGGGAVSGVSDTSNLIRTIHAQVKPVVAFTDGMMASAAYWLGSSAGKVYGSATSVMGSIGVITTHKEYSKMFKEAGIGVTVLRAGEFKALANENEPLSAAATKQITEMLQSAYDVFIGHVADMRGTSVAIADKTMGQGREFFGDQAVTAGIADAITSFDDLLGQFGGALLDKQTFSLHNSVNNSLGNKMTKKALTATEITALAAGITASVEVEPTAVVTAATTLEAVTAVEVVAAAAVVTEAKNGNDSGVQFLQAQLREQGSELLQARVDLGLMAAKLAPMQAAVTGLSAIVATSVSSMRVALSQAALDLSAMPPEQLLAEHSSTASSFTKHFKAGGVAAVGAGEQSREETLSPHHMARINATRFNNK